MMVSINDIYYFVAKSPFSCSDFIHSNIYIHILNKEKTSRFYLDREIDFNSYILAIKNNNNHIKIKLIHYQIDHF